MINIRSSKSGFTLIEVIASAALLGIMAAMLIPSLSGAGDRVKNARMQSDLAVIDQAIELYRLDEGHVPESLDDLTDGYLSRRAELHDARGQRFTYTADSAGGTYLLKGCNAGGAEVTSAGSRSENAGG